MKEIIYISHVVGWCAVCGFYILDTGYSDDMDHEWLYDILYSEQERNNWFFSAFHGDWES